MARKKSVIPNAQTLRTLAALTGQAPARQKRVSNPKNPLADTQQPPDESWHSVSSSNLESIKYNLQNNTLEIKFLRKGPGTYHFHYRYYGCPYSVYWNLRNAPSKGKYHHAAIKGVYSYVIVA